MREKEPNYCAKKRKSVTSRDSFIDHNSFRKKEVFSEKRQGKYLKGGKIISSDTFFFLQKCTFCKLIKIEKMFVCCFCFFFLKLSSKFILFMNLIHYIYSLPRVTRNTWCFSFQMPLRHINCTISGLWMLSILLKQSHIQGVKSGSNYKNVGHLLIKIYAHTSIHALHPASS